MQSRYIDLEVNHNIPFKMNLDKSLIKENGAFQNNNKFFDGFRKNSDAKNLSYKSVPSSMNIIFG